MYHRLAVHIYQSPSDIFELSEEIINSGQSVVEVEAYKFNPISIPASLDKLVDVPIFHPLRCHCEVVFTHHHSDQW